MLRVARAALPATQEPATREPSRIARAIGPFVAIFALGLLVRALPVLRGGGLFADLGYDDGVYFAAAVAAVHGLVPYRDFLFLHPPGIVIVLAPFAWVGDLTTSATGLALARVAFMVIGATNALLVALIAGKRHGRLAAICAGLLYAAWHASAGFERTTILPGPENALLLLGLLTLEWRHGNVEAPISSRRAALAGVFLGLAMTIQLWEVVPLAVIVGWQAVRSLQTGRRSLNAPIAIAAGATAAFGIACLPFLVIAGPQMIRYILVDQLARPNLGVPWIARLRLLEGLPPSGITLRYVPNPLVVAAAAATALVVAVGAWCKPEIRIWAVLLAAQTAVLLVIQAFYPHYAAWIAPVGSIAIGASVATIIDRFARQPRRARPAALVYAMVVMIVLLPNIVRTGEPLPVATLDQHLAAARCVAADRPILLIETATLQRDLDAACPLVLDTTGTSYDVGRGGLMSGAAGAARVNAAAYQRAMLAYYTGSAATMLDQLPADGLSSATWSAIRCHFAIQLQLKPVTLLLSAGQATGASSGCP